MDNHIHAIGAFEAKTRLSELLRRTENGEEFVIQRRGRPVARLIPFDSLSEPLQVADIVGEMNAVRESVPGPIEIRELINEGRRV
jgi:prevent-host-death family protein